MGAPRSDHVHFTGRRKPWFHGPPANLTEENHLASDAHFWYYHLDQLNDELDMGLNFTGWTTGRSRRPLLGMYPLYGAVLTSNTNLVGTEVEDVGDDDDNDNGNTNQSMNVTRHNRTSSHTSVSHHEHGSLLTNVTDIVPDITEMMADDSTAVATDTETSVSRIRASSGTAARSHTAKSRHIQRLRSSAAVLNDSPRIVSSEQEIA